ncbi:MAG: aminotransferase class I/II-fold pyridoxal phosphate-dependent enzyme [Gemmatimonadota bacterium]
MRLTRFEMERYQSTFEHRVRYNLSESGVHPMTTRELLELAGSDLDVLGIRLEYGQSNGSDQLRENIAALYPDCSEASVLVTVGGAEANFTACWRLMESGQKVAVMVPNYMQVPGLLQTFGAQPLTFPLLEETGWQPDLDRLRACLDEGARFILVTNPNNPTGSILTEASMDGIVQEAERVGAWILADEVYQGAELDGRQSPSFHGRSERVLVTNSLSKAYGLPGLRLGWIIAPGDLREDLWSRTDYTTITPATLSDALATLAVERKARERIRARTREILNRNLPLLVEWMKKQDGLFSYRLPQAGAICYVRYDAPINSTELAERLRTERDVLVVPGDHFGMDHYLRIGIGPPEELLLEGLERVAQEFRAVGV